MCQVIQVTMKPDPPSVAHCLSSTYFRMHLTPMYCHRVKLYFTLFYCNRSDDRSAIIARVLTAAASRLLVRLTSLGRSFSFDLGILIQWYAGHKYCYKSGSISLNSMHSGILIYDRSTRNPQSS